MFVVYITGHLLFGVQDYSAFKVSSESEARAARFRCTWWYTQPLLKIATTLVNYGKGSHASKGNTCSTPDRTPSSARVRWHVRHVERRSLPGVLPFQRPWPTSLGSSVLISWENRREPECHTQNGPLKCYSCNLAAVVTTIPNCFVHFRGAVFSLVAMMVSCFRTVDFLKSSSFMVALPGIVTVLLL